MPELWVPAHLRPARQRTSIVFYRHGSSKRLMVGFPEHFPAPHGFEKIVCHSAADVEKYSKMLNAQDKADQEMNEYQRELVEGPIRDACRKELQHLMMNARNQLNRDFCAYALRRIEEREKKGRMIRESFQHIEAYEAGH